jgi:nuclease HARBI1
VTKARLAQLFSILRKSMPTQRNSRLRVDERRFRRVILLSAACSSRGSQPFDFASASSLLMWLRRRSDIQAARVLRASMLSRVFNLDVLTNYDVIFQMRFSKRHIRILASLIPWRETTILGQVRTSRRRYCASKEEALCVLLSRLAMPSRVEDLVQRFFRCKAAINKIFYEALERFLDWAGPLVSTFQTTFLRSRAEYYASKISAKSDNATQHCVGLIDGTLVEIARPSGIQQRATYSGHKGHPGLKWQVIRTPDGLVFHIFGPCEGRRHDMHLYAESGLDEILSEELLIDAVQHYVFGDSGYTLRPCLMTPFEEGNLTEGEVLFNKRMSKARVSVEWAFKDVKKYFSHIAFSRKIVLSRAPGGAWYSASCLLWNFRCCLDGSPTSKLFDCYPQS